MQWLFSFYGENRNEHLDIRHHKAIRKLEKDKWFMDLSDSKIIYLTWFDIIGGVKM